MNTWTQCLKINHVKSSLLNMYLHECNQQKQLLHLKIYVKTIPLFNYNYGINNLTRNSALEVEKSIWRKINQPSRLTEIFGTFRNDSRIHYRGGGVYLQLFISQKSSWGMPPSSHLSSKCHIIYFSPLKKSEILRIFLRSKWQLDVPDHEIFLRVRPPLILKKISCF